MSSLYERRNAIVPRIKVPRKESEKVIAIMYLTSRNRLCQPYWKIVKNAVVDELFK